MGVMNTHKMDSSAVPIKKDWLQFNGLFRNIFGNRISFGSQPDNIHEIVELKARLMES